MARLLVAFLWLFAVTLPAQAETDELEALLNATTEYEFLEVDEAFQIEADFIAGETIIRWQIAPHYYLYRHALATEANSAEISSTYIPEGLMKDDPYFGRVEVYDTHLEIALTMAAMEQRFEVLVSYQGCAEAGLCYTPETRKLSFVATADGSYQLDGPIEVAAPIRKASAPPRQAPTETSNEAPEFKGERELLSDILAEGDLLWISLAFLGAGLLLTFTPCVLPMIPILSSIIAGQGSNVTTAKAFKLSFVYVQAMALTYAIFGILVAQAGGSLSGFLQSPIVLMVVAGLFVLLSLSMFGLYELQLPQFIQDKLQNMSSKQQGGQYVSVALMGVLATLVVSPCTSAPLTAALLLIAQKGDVWTGGFSLYMLGMGMGVPLLLIGAGGGKWLPKAGMWMDAVKAAFGYMMLGLALYITSHLMPDGLYLGLWALLLAHAAYRYGALQALKSMLSNLRQVLAVGLLILAVIYAIGATNGNNRLLDPLEGIVTESNRTAHLEFEKVADLEALQQRLVIAKEDQQPVMLDFYAEWCVACYEFEDLTFRDADVQAYLEAHNVLLLQVDVTENNVADRNLMKHYKVLGLPTIMFFDSTGTERTNSRATGFEDAEAFLQRLQAVYY